MSEQVIDATVTEAPVDQPTPAPAPQLQLQDLLLAVQVIQLAGQRGAIKAEEMTAIGGLYERLVAFLQASGALKPAESAEQQGN
jgi:hypothetical protein